MAAVLPEHQAWLTDALGSEAERVKFVDMGRLGANPARILPAWREFVDQYDGRPVRGIGEPIWPGRRSAELVESQLHEALLNVAVEPEIPLWLVCPYDAEQLPPDIVEEAHRSHPVIVECDQFQGSASYSGRPHVDTMFSAELPGLTGEPIITTIQPGNAERLEAYVRLETYVSGLSAGQAAALAEAAQQVALGSIHRGAAELTVGIWNEPDAVICEVADQTVLADPLHGRRLPIPDEHEGLWRANQLCDLVQLRSTPYGTTVRLHAWR